jgi:hypothetical protein
MIDWKNIDVCKFAEDGNSFSFVKEYLDDFESKMPGLIRRCPFEIYKVNLSLSQNNPNKKTAVIPNGNLKAIVVASNNRDKNILTVILDLIVNVL